MGKWKIIRPTAARNLVTNPSFETNVTGWAAIGTGEIVRASSPSGIIENVYGSKIGLVALNASGDGVYYAITLDAFTTYYLQLSLGSFAPFTVKVAIIRTDTSAEVASENITLSVLPSVGNRFSKLNFSFTTPATTSFRINITHVSGAISMPFTYFMIDGVQVATENTTYIDGDQPGCVWEGVPHNSISRSLFLLSTSRAAGILVDFQDDYGFYIREAKGVGMPSPDWDAIKRGAPYAGSTVTSVRTPARGISLKGTLVGTSHTNINDTRNQIINDVSPYLVPFVNGVPQPVHLRYEGTEKTLELLCDYKGGLDKDFNEVETYTDEFALQFMAHDNPYWQETADTTAVLNTQNTLAIYGVAAQIKGIWSALGITSLSGAVPRVRAVKWGPDGKLYFGGSFTQVNAVANTSYIARYNPVTEEIESLSSTSLGSTVYALFFAPDHTLYVGGTFANGVTKWKDTIYGGTGEWVSLVESNPLNGPVKAFALNSENGNILMGGGFTTGSGVSLNYIAQYDGSSFSAIGTGMNSEVWAIACLQDGRNTILAGGDFTTAGGNAATYIAAYTSADGWFSIGTLDDRVYAIAVYQQGAVVSGAFRTFNTESAHAILKITGITADYTGWETLPGVPDGTVSIYCVAVSNDNIYAMITRTNAPRLAILCKWINGNIVYGGLTYYSAVVGLSLDVDQYDNVATGGSFNGAIASAFTPGITDITSPNGASEAYFTITLSYTGGTYGSVHYIQILNNGDLINVPITFIDGEIITIDSRTMRITSNFNRVLHTWPGSVPIKFTAGINRVAISSFTDGSITATIVYRQQYYSYDAAEGVS